MVVSFLKIQTPSFIFEGRGFFMEERMKKIHALLLTLFFCVSVHALPVGKLRGTVLDKESGLPLAYADVLVLGTKAGASTDAEGFYEITVAPGRYNIAARCTGYRTETRKNILLPADRMTRLHFKLKKEILKSAAIVVEGRKESALRMMLPSHVRRIELLNSTRIRNMDLAQILTAGNGMFIKSYGASGQLQTIALRGMSAEQTQVLLDGIPINNMQLGSADIGFYTTSDLQSIDIYRGGSALFGGSGAVGGTVNFHLHSPSEHAHYSLRAGAASFGNVNAGISINLPLGKFKQRFYYSEKSANNTYSIVQNGLKTKLRNRDFSRRNLTYSNRIQVYPGLAFSSFIKAFTSDAGAPKAFINAQTEQSNKARLKNDNTLVSVKMKYRGAQGELNLQSYLRNEWMEYRDRAFLLNGQPLHSLHFNKETGVFIRGRYLPFPSLLLMGGAEGSLQKINSSAAGKRRRTRTALYMTSGWQIYEDQTIKTRVAFNASLRLERDSHFGAIFLPGAGITVRYHNVRLYSSMGKNYRAPSFNDLYWVPGGNADLKPERSFNVEGGARYKAVLDSFSVSMTGALYQNRVSDQIKWLPRAGVWQPFNILEVDSRGVEMESSVAHVNGRHRLWFNYRYGLAKKAAAEFEGDATNGNRLPLIPAEQWSAGLQSGWKNFRSGLQAAGTGFRYITMQNDAEQILPAHTIWRLWVSVRFKAAGQKAAFSASVENLLDKRYEVMPGYPMPPRNFRLGLTIGK